MPGRPELTLTGRFDEPLSSRRVADSECTLHYRYISMLSPRDVKNGVPGAMPIPPQCHFLLSCFLFFVHTKLGLACCGYIHIIGID
jgi:hypothetical protein